MHHSSGISQPIDLVTGKADNEMWIGSLDDTRQNASSRRSIHWNSQHWNKRYAHQAAHTPPDPIASTTTHLGVSGTAASHTFSVADAHTGDAIDALRLRQRLQSRRRTPSSTPASSSAGYSSVYGYGLVNAAAAVSKAINNQTTATSGAATGNNHAALEQVNAPGAWSQGYTGQGVVVAVVDSGVDYRHSDLNGNIWTNPGEIPGNGIDDDGDGYVDDVHGWDFVTNDNAPIDQNGHGTHVAGTIAAENNGTGATGVAYNAKIMPVRVLDANGYGGISTIAKGVRYAADRGAKVINLSLGGQSSTALTQSILYAANKGAVVVMAAGNEGASQPTAPANLANQVGIAVGAVDSQSRLARFSNRAGASTKDYLVAPGVNILSTEPNSTYGYESGTSMATPFVSGAAALVFSANPNLTASAVETILTQTANSSLAALRV